MTVTFHGAGTLVDATSGSTIGPIPLPASAASGDFVIVGVVAHGRKLELRQGVPG